MRSIDSKLRWLVLLSVGAASLVIAALALWNEAERYARERRDVLLSTGHVLAAAAAQPVKERDQSAVLRVIRAFAKIPGIDYVGVEGEDGDPIGSLGSAIRLSSDLDLTEPGSLTMPLRLLWTGSLRVSVPVEDGREPIGRVVVVGNTIGLVSGLQRIALLALLGSLLAVSIGLAIALRLQRGITGPLVELAKAMRGVQARHDYAVTCAVRTDDEIGVLATSFNAMMTEIREREQEIVHRLARAAEYRDTDTGEHVSRVADYVRRIARELGLDAGACDRLALASTMHDVGKIGVADAILRKPGPLTRDERAQMELHTRWAGEILGGSRSELVQLAAEIAASHHERWDGCGYPHGLSGEQIPLSGRIVAVADVFDALVSDRPYKAAWRVSEAKDYLEAESGRHFDPACVRAFLASLGEIAPAAAAGPGLRVA